MINRKLVIAATYASYRYFIKRNNLSFDDYKYLEHISEAAGVHELLLLGRYTANPAYRDIGHLLSAYKCEWLDIDEDYPKTRVEIIYA